MAASIASTSYSLLSSSETVRSRTMNPINISPSSARRICRPDKKCGNYSKVLFTQMRGAPIQSSKAVNIRSRTTPLAPLAVHTFSSPGTSKRASLPSPKSPLSPAERNTKGWTDEEGNESIDLVAQFRNIALAARSRGEMHAIIGLQRDNWNKLCHNTVVTTTIAAAMLAAINGATPALTLSLTAFLLNAGTAGLMFLASNLQPSQLAEEQRTAARQFTSMADEIESTLLTDPRLREDAHLYMDDKLNRMEALDIAYPLPLIPNGLPKFPKVVKPSVLNTQVDLSEPEMPANNSNGWSQEITEDLKQTAEKLRSGDVDIYLGWARKKKRENLRLSIAAPALVAAAALFNMAQCLPLGLHTTGLAATCSVAAMFCFSFSQGGQIGMIFEMYRNCAGSFADMDNTIQRSIRIPVCQREDGGLFLQKIALQLGRRNELPLVHPEDKTAGKVF